MILKATNSNHRVNPVHSSHKALSFQFLIDTHLEPLVDCQIADTGFEQDLKNPYFDEREGRIVSLRIFYRPVVISFGSLITASSFIVFRLGILVNNLWCHLIGLGIALIGILVTAFGIVQPYRRKCLLFPKWDIKKVNDCIASLRKDEKLRILQTWLPDYELFIPFLQDLLIRENKQFQIEVLLLDPNIPESDMDLIKSRVIVRYTVNEREEAVSHIKKTIQKFINLKKVVDKHWRKNNVGHALNIDIRTYRFMPCSPIYQIGDRHMFVGFFLNYKTSAEAPMLEIKDKNSRLWDEFAQQWKVGWENSTEYPIS